MLNEITSYNKADVIREFARDERDTGSSIVQVALLTYRIKSLTEHMKQHPKDVHSRRGLLAMVSLRKKLLWYLKKHDKLNYDELLNKLKIRGVS